MKLYSIKSEVRYSPTMILAKLVGSYNLSQVTLRISDIKRTKMVSSFRFYFKTLLEMEVRTSLSDIFHTGANSEPLLQQQDGSERHRAQK